MRAIIGHGTATQNLVFARETGLFNAADTDLGLDSLGKDVVAVGFDPSSDRVALVTINSGTPAGLFIYETRGYTRVIDLSASLGYTSGSSFTDDEGYFVRFSPDGSKLAVAMLAFPFVQIFDTSDWSLYNPPSTDYALNGIAIYRLGLDWDPTSTFLAISMQENGTRLRVYDCSTTTPSQVFTVIGHVNNSSRGVAWSPNGALLAWGNHPTDVDLGLLGLYETAGWTHVSSPQILIAARARTVSWQGNYLLVQGKNNPDVFRVYNTGGSNDPATWTLTNFIPTIASGKRPVTACLTRGTADVGLAYRAFDGTIGFATPPTQPAASHVYSTAVGGISYNIDAKSVVDDSEEPTPKLIAMSVDASPYVLFFNQTGAQLGLTLSPEPENPTLAKLYPDGSKVLTNHYDSVTFDSVARVYDMADGSLLSTLYTAADPEYLNHGSAISPDGTKIALSVSETPGIRFFNAATYAAYSAVDTPIHPSDSNFNGLCRWSPDSRYCAVHTYNTFDGIVTRRVYDTLTTSPTLVAAANQDGSSTDTDESGDWSPDGTRFVSGLDDGDNLIKVYNTTGWTTVTGPTQPVWDEPFNIRWSGDYIYLWQATFGRAYYYDTGGSNDATTWTLHPMRRLGYSNLVNATLAGTPDVLIQASPAFEKTQLYSPPTTHHANGISFPGAAGYSNIYDVSVVEGPPAPPISGEAIEETALADEFTGFPFRKLFEILASADSNIGQNIKNVLEALATSDSAFASTVHGLFERVGISDALTGQQFLNATIIQSFSAADEIRAIFQGIVQEILDAGDTWQGDFLSIARVVDSLMLSGQFTARMDAIAVLALSLTLGDRAFLLTTAQIEELLDTDETLAARLVANLTLAESLDTVMTVLAGRAALVGLVEGTALSDVLDPIAQMKAMLTEGMEFEVELILLGEVYQGWVVNNENGAPSEYANFPFNSMARVGQSYYGASETGLYLMGGDRDDGDPIQARILTGEMDFGSPQIKRVERAYMGYSTTGDLVLKVIATVNGTHTEFWYRATPLRTGDVTQTRVPIGRGIDSRYWQFELVNTDGADFELDRLDLQVLNLQRRI